MIDHSVVNVALPKIIRGIGATASEQQWIVDAYIVVFAGLLLTVGVASDRWGRKRFLLAGLVIFGLSSVGATLARTSVELIAARAVTGLGASFIMPPTLSTLTLVFTDRSEFNRAIGAWAATAGVGGAIGPSLGGWLVDEFGWQGAFWLNVPVAAVALVMGIFLVPGSRSSRPQRLDPVGALLAAGGLALFLWAIIGAPERSWLSPGTLGTLAGGAVLLAGFAIWSLHHPDPMLDPRIFRGPRVTPAIVTVGVGFIALGSALFFITQYLQFVLGYSPLRAGIGILPVAIAVAVSAPVGAALGIRFGVRQVTMTGLALLAAGLGALAIWTTKDSYLATGFGLFLAGVGLGLGTASATGIIMTRLPPSAAGTASALNNLTHEIASALGIGIFGSLLATGYRSRVGSLLGQLGLSPGAHAVAGDNVGGAINVAGQLHRAQAADLMSTARDAFLNSMHVALGVTVALVVLSLLTASRLPGRGPRVTSPTAARPEREAQSHGNLRDLAALHGMHGQGAGNPGHAAHAGTAGHEGSAGRVGAEPDHSRGLLHDLAALHGHGGAPPAATDHMDHSGAARHRPDGLLNDLAALHGHGAAPRAEAEASQNGQDSHARMARHRPHGLFNSLAALHGHGATPEGETDHGGHDGAAQHASGHHLGVPGPDQLAALHTLAAFHSSSQPAPELRDGDPGDPGEHEEHEEPAASGECEQSPDA